MNNVLIINGPNLNLVGNREKDIYGDISMDSIIENAKSYAAEYMIDCDYYQSNSEGAIISYIQESATLYDVIILNAGAYSHYSLAIADAIAAVQVPVIEVHMSNIYSRGEERKTSVIAPVCKGQITGFGGDVYILAIDAAMKVADRDE